MNMNAFQRFIAAVNSLHPDSIDAEELFKERCFNLSHAYFQIKVSVKAV